jgi:hypothetical protein
VALRGGQDGDLAGGVWIGRHVVHDKVALAGAMGDHAEAATVAGSTSPALATAWPSSKATTRRWGLWEDDIEKVPS